MIETPRLRLQYGLNIEPLFFIGVGIVR
eukprot:SAG11_NODE_4761_length_1777_cov_1.262217_3_plen_27_part_01